MVLVARWVKNNFPTGGSIKHILVDETRARLSHRARRPARLHPRPARDHPSRRLDRGAPARLHRPSGRARRRRRGGSGGGHDPADRPSAPPAPGRGKLRARVWDVALEEGRLRSYDEAVRRGRDGMVVPVARKGKVVGHRLRFNDRLLYAACYREPATRYLRRPRQD